MSKIFRHLVHSCCFYNTAEEELIQNLTMNLLRNKLKDQWLYSSWSFNQQM